MFIGNMVTEAIPARVYALYKIVASKKEISRSDLQGLMEPSGIYEGSSYFSTIMKAATELKLVDIQDNMVYSLVPKEKINSIDDMRIHAISRLISFEGEQFYRCTNAIVNLNEEIFKFKSVSDNDMLTFLSEKAGQNVTAPMARGWRFWAQFLGFGYMNDFTFLPNAYIFVKNVIKLMDLEKKKEYQMDEFMSMFNQYGRILTDNAPSEKYLNLALSSALRELHENDEITIRYISDQASKWILFPSNDLFNNPVSAIVYKGVK
jgi:hypothetical protein